MTMIERLGAELAGADLDGLAELLVDAVAGNASVGFPADLTHERAREFWVGVAASARAGRVILLVARVDGRIAGTVQLVFSQYPNGRVRAEVAKLLVRSSMRRRGLGAGLMRAAEKEARRAARRLLVLDTETGSAAEELYRKLGWTLVGVIPDYAYRPDGELRPTSFYYKRLGPGA